MRRKLPEFDDRYDSRYWRDIKAIAHRASRNTCCYCLSAPSAEVHHVRYSDEHGAIAGRELPGIDVFPVCEPCHKILHTPAHWIKDKRNPVLGNHQKTEASDRLKSGFLLLSKLPCSTPSPVLRSVVPQRSH